MATMTYTLVFHVLFTVGSTQLYMHILSIVVYNEVFFILRSFCVLESFLICVLSFFILLFNIHV